MSDKQNRYLVKEALMMAIENRQPKPGLIHHTDQGIQYASHDYQAILNAHDMIPSMSRKGNCHDNAVAESFFHTLKEELVYDANFATRKEAKQSIFKYIELYYNRQRLHSFLGYKAPLKYERMNVA